MEARPHNLEPSAPVSTPGHRRSVACRLIRSAVGTTLLLGLAGAPGCSSIERGRYAVTRLELDGMRQMQPQSLRECLLTRERERLTIRLGAATATCSEPPFSSAPPEVKLWSWGWADYPTFNRSVLDQDVARILRWYRARGFYEASVRDVAVDPPAAAQGKPCPSSPCLAHVRVEIDEGEPIRVHGVELEGLEPLPPALQRTLREAVTLSPGDRFDEFDYDNAKRALKDSLRAGSFADARVEGKVEVDAELRRARVSFQLTPGPPYAFGSTTIVGQGSLPVAPIRFAAGLRPGEPYHPTRVEEVRVEVLALGAFSSVEVREKPDRERRQIDLTLAVTPRPTDALRLGVGVTSGASHRSETGDLESVPQWDVHLFGSYERRHILGTLGSLRIEDHPRLIFGDVFPRVVEPSLGNILSLYLHEPGIIESRTDLFSETTWDYGPDPFLGFSRSDISVRVGVRRGFFVRHLLATASAQQDVLVVPDEADNVTSDGSPTPSSYRYGFLQQDMKLDLRDQATQPRSGAYFALNSTEALRSPLSDWTSLRLLPDTRVYMPLPFSSTLALRLTLGALIIFDANEGLDDLSRRLGPSSYRLRGGGANSVRGFLPGELGAGSQGGLRRWESMLEWRVRFGQFLTTVAFVDVGDVNDEEVFRFDHLNTSVGLGLRYFTVIGPLRLDLGFRIPDWQRLGPGDTVEEGASTLPFTDIAGALHLTIGDSF
jgi:outer membrane translocation and assembly module TamA